MTGDLLVSLVRIEVKGKAPADVYLTVTSLAYEKTPYPLSVFMVGASNGAVRSGQLAFSASWFSPPGDKHAQVQLYAQARSGGNSAGGASWRLIPSATELAGYFSISAAEGDYPLDSPVKIGDVDGQPLMLTVGQPPKAAD